MSNFPSAKSIREYAAKLRELAKKADEFASALDGLVPVESAPGLWNVALTTLKAAAPLDPYATSGIIQGKGTVKEVVYRALKTEGKPTALASLHEQFQKTTGRTTSIDSFGSMLSREKSIFRPVSRGIWGLVEWQTNASSPK